MWSSTRILEAPAFLHITASFLTTSGWVFTPHDIGDRELIFGFITTLLPGESHGVVYTESAADMAGEVVSLLKSAERRQKLGQAGLHYVRENFGYEKIARELERILEDTIKEKQNGAKARST